MLFFDLVCLPTLKGHSVIISQNYCEFWVYDDFQEEMDMFNKPFCEVMYGADGNENIFSFFIPTHNLHEGFDWDAPRMKLVWRMTAKLAISYFTNFIGSNLYSSIDPLLQPSS